MVIGVAGKYSAGKDRVIEALSELIDTDIIDVDALGHEALEEQKEELRRAFGDAVIGEDGTVDRKALGALVFDNAGRLGALESIVHPVMREKAGRYIREKQGRGGTRRAVVINAALLFYMGLDRYCDSIIWVTACPCIRIRRAKQRDGLSTGEALRRFRSQRKLKHKQIGANTDIYTIRNNSSIENLRKKVAEFLRRKGML